MNPPSPSPSRGADALSPSTAERILDAASESFALYGYRGASVRTIATAAGLQAPSMYNHFANKGDLLVAIGQRYFTALLPALQAAADAPGDGVTRLEGLIRTASAVGISRRNDHLTMVRELLQVHLAPEAEPLLASGQQANAIWHSVIREGQQDGSLRRDIPPAGMTWLIFTTITGVVDPGRRVHALRDAMALTVETLCTVLIDGLRSQTGRDAQPAE